LLRRRVFHLLAVINLDAEPIDVPGPKPGTDDKDNNGQAAELSEPDHPRTSAQ
jgi:hypothetical protein